MMETTGREYLTKEESDALQNKVYKVCSDYNRDSRFYLFGFYTRLQLSRECTNIYNRIYRKNDLIAKDWKAVYALVIEKVGTKEGIHYFETEEDGLWDLHDRAIKIITSIVESELRVKYTILKELGITVFSDEEKKNLANYGADSGHMMPSNLDHQFMGIELVLNRLNDCRRELGWQVIALDQEKSIDKLTKLYIKRYGEIK